MNGNWGGIASRDFDRSRNGVGNQNHDGFGPDPSLDVINTIVSTLNEGCLVGVTLNQRRLDSIVRSVGSRRE